MPSNATAATETAAPKRVVGAATSRVVKSHAGAKVVVASKLPMALELSLETKTIQERRFQGSIWTEEVYVPVPDTPKVTISGTNYPIGAPPPGVLWPERPRMARGAALTFNVDKDFWETWAKQKKDSPFIKNNLVAAFDNEADARAWAGEHQKQKSGLDPMIPDTDPRWPRKVSAIEARKVAQGEDEDEVAAAGA